MRRSRASTASSCPCGDHSTVSSSGTTTGSTTVSSTGRCCGPTSISICSRTGAISPGGGLVSGAVMRAHAVMWSRPCSTTHMIVREAL